MNHVERQNLRLGFRLYRATRLYGHGSALVLGRNVAEATREAFEVLGTKDVLFLDAKSEAHALRDMVTTALAEARAESAKGRR
jgi:hypothetical protein